MSWLRWGAVFACVWSLLGGAAVAIAQDNPSPESLKNMYETLKRDQDRISSLAHDNEQLQAKVKELQKDLAAADADKADLHRQMSDEAERSYFLRRFHSAWQGFVSQYPDVMIRWQAYLNQDPFSGPESDSFVDPYWPLSARG